MHKCPDCGEWCICDFDDCDFGDKHCGIHICEDVDEYETYDEYIIGEAEQEAGGW